MNDLKHLNSMAWLQEGMISNVCKIPSDFNRDLQWRQWMLSLSLPYHLEKAIDISCIIHHLLSSVLKNSGD
jgi:hypothetical protein